MANIERFMFIHLLKYINMNMWLIAGRPRRPLQQANLPIVTQPTCRSNAWLGGQFFISDRMMCAGYEQGGIDSCQVLKENQMIVWCVGSYSMS